MTGRPILSAIVTTDRMVERTKYGVQFDFLNGMFIICVMVLERYNTWDYNTTIEMLHAFWIIRFIQIIMRDSSGIMKPKRHVDVFRYHLIINIEYSNIFLEMCFIFIFIKLSFAKRCFFGELAFGFKNMFMFDQKISKLPRNC